LATDAARANVGSNVAVPLQRGKNLSITCICEEIGYSDPISGLAPGPAWLALDRFREEYFDKRSTGVQNVLSRRLEQDHLCRRRERNVG